MSWGVIPLTAYPDQEVITTVEIAGENVPIRVRLRYNTEAECWFMTAADGKTGAVLIDSIPCVTGKLPAHDLLAQHQHLGLGSAIIAPASAHPPTENPDEENLGAEFVLLWGDASE